MSAAVRAALPEALRARVHTIGSGEARSGGFVLYWLRTAARAHENPALDVALLAAESLGLPLFVYHAVSEQYPYAADRHHRFILEGARDVAADFADRRIGYALHVERPGHRGPHLVTLADRAALVVTEDMPVEPLDAWTESLAERIGRPVWAVDTACLVPMRSIAQQDTTRAFRFRRQTEQAREAVVRSTWHEVPSPGSPFVPDLPFEPVDPASADFAALIASCEIDHSIAPVPHTPGGSKAGYARWDDFRARGLQSYAQRRNDATEDAVSRMSAYLHYGHVSPFRLAREAAEVGGEGAEKYLDELLVWREMAYAFCARHPGHDTVRGGVPEWAKRSLAAHEGDERSVVSWERLARGRTGDRLWDAAQASLRIHGELHNNVRMTWGKALVGWTATAGEALERLLDLNHRYALDGRDPASYGGILWCLGQFDRPFDTETPIFGQVRARSTAGHAERFDVELYRSRAESAAWRDAPRVAVIGAGVSGLAAARVLADHGLEVSVFDKGRRLGGRANTRIHDQRRFDHGAQFFTVRSPLMERHLESWIDEGVVAEWTGRIVRIGSSGTEPAKPSRRFVGQPGMIDLPFHMAQGLEVEGGVRIDRIEGRPGEWRLRDDRQDYKEPFGVVLVAAPALQARSILAPVAPALGRLAVEAPMEPCWAVMIAFARPVDADFDGAFVEPGPLAWVARDSSKPGRPQGESWVLHASPEWSREHLQDRPEAVGDQLRRAFSKLVGRLPAVAFSRAHRWGYARGGMTMPEHAAFDAALGLGMCGDWCVGGRMEGAFQSGVAAAGMILGQAPARPENPFAPGRAEAAQYSLLSDVVS